MCTTIIEEEWRDIAGYEGLYQVSNLGRVKTLGNNRSRREKIRKPQKNNVGYLLVTLRKNGKQKQLLVHRLIAKTFIPNPYNMPQVNHKDENKENNNVHNLEWCDAKYNANYGTRNERAAKTKKSKQILCVETGIVFPSSYEAERKTGADHSSIIKCCRGKYKTVKGFHWQYAE